MVLDSVIFLILFVFVLFDFIFWLFFVFRCLFLFFFFFYTTILAILPTAGQRSTTSFGIGPLNKVPFGLPLSSLSTTAALSSNLMRMPSGRRNSFLCRTMIASTTVFLISNFPFLTDASTISPIPAAGIRPRTVLCPLTATILSNFAPELSQVSTAACSGNTFGILHFIAFIDVHLILLFLLFPLQFSSLILLFFLRRRQEQR